MIALYRFLFLIFLIVLWWVISLNVRANFIPSPWATLLAAQKLLADGKLIVALGDSLITFAGGYALGILVAIPVGLVMGVFLPVGKTLEIYVYALAAMPRVAFIPLIIVFLGLGFPAKIFIVFLGAVMPVLINTYAGVLAVDQELIEMARSVRAGRMQIFARIVLPSAVPFIIVGLRLGATIALINTVVAELYTAVRGLGGLLAIYGNTFRMAEYFVIVIVLAIIGVIVSEGLRHLEKRLVRWKTSD
ncbi:MAG: transporter permease [Devosia sp.]|uniref:ABC transporter permease n=1 Tax=Devosia sp. TaxID=1871048 RepID=UPI0026277FB4|nr:ABC transporter permease [Devosia sp.]MDB5527952.1 transporter permease [Devosia sp.]MDB5587732.1 transporter permease [Devosia sp.]